MSPGTRHSPEKTILMPSAEAAFLSRNSFDEPLLRLNGLRQCLLGGENPCYESVRFHRS